jgi:hypothetical protein
LYQAHAAPVGDKGTVTADYGRLGPEVARSESVRTFRKMQMARLGGGMDNLRRYKCHKLITVPLRTCVRQVQNTSDGRHTQLYTLTPAVASHANLRAHEYPA